ncbi:imidazolonepropionase-like protein [Sarcoptes scabiei]|uniref:imidazolonepropionase n=1 Tax=Sarcoptes scabiei TaxID=52283 RepID=A0A132A8Y9_SARSC|nr:imidazolonepropionase-like protein [Sarcoptes scabiei]
MSNVPRLAIRNCDQIVTICSKGQRFLSGTKQDQIEVRERDGDRGLSIVFGQDGLIKTIDYDDKIDDWLQKFCENDAKKVMKIIDGKGRSIIPGLVDAHCHPIWSGDRVNEFDLKLRGATYMQIHKSGGGINKTVRETKHSKEEELLRTLLKRIKSMVRCGSTTIECKTGYGLDYGSEKKLLQVIKQAASFTKAKIVTTFLGAHSIPEGMTAEQGVENVLNILDKLREDNEDFDFVDVFCEKDIYDAQQTERMLLYAKKNFPNCEITLHGDELSDQNCGALAARIGARSVSHLEFLNNSGIEAMAAKKIAAIINPTTCYLLQLPKPPVRRMIEASVPIVLATDYNPNAMCKRLPSF